MSRVLLDGEASDDLQADLARLAGQLAKIDIAGIHASVRNDVLPNYPAGLRHALASEYLKTATPLRVVLQGEERAKALGEGRGADSWAQANQQLYARHRQLKACKVHLACSDAAIRDMARQCGEICTGLARRRSAETAYHAVGAIAARHRITMPVPGRGKTVKGCVARLCDPKWWRRALRGTYARQAENLERELGLVSRRRGLYASDDAVTRRHQQKIRNRAMLESMLAVNDLGESFQLSELSDVNVSNPRIRRAELMTRIAGFEEYAKAAGDQGLFVTLTLPSRFHCMRSKSCDPNPRFDGSAARDGQRFLCRQWQRLRSYAQRSGLDFYGFRIAEPHHDGTVHWHLLLFLPAAQIALLEAAMRKYFDPAEEAEPGSAEARVKSVLIDPTKGSAAGYVAKYVAKNIDGFRVGADFESVPEPDLASGLSARNSAPEPAQPVQLPAPRDATRTAERVDAWASTHGIRQFQQIGGPPVSIWRELRRVANPCSGDLEQARLAAEDQDWGEFCRVLGGMKCPNRRRPVRLHVSRSAQPGVYGDPIERQIKGVCAGSLIVLTRVRSWRFMRASSESSSPWTRVNNCTEMEEAISERSYNRRESCRIGTRPGEHRSRAFRSPEEPTQAESYTRSYRRNPATNCIEMTVRKRSLMTP